MFLTILRYYQLPFERISYDYEVEFAHDPIYLAGKFLELTLFGFVLLRV
jgi:hypothetical protein